MGQKDHNCKAKKNWLRKITLDILILLIPEEMRCLVFRLRIQMYLVLSWLVITISKRNTSTHFFVVMLRKIFIFRENI
jgi:hypothetical protein